MSDEELLEDLAFRCAEAEDRAAELEAVCAEHPEHADAVRRLVARLSMDDRLLFAEAGVDGAEPAATQMESGPLAEAGPDSAEKAKSQFGRYRLLDLLGEGGMGSVHRAYDEDLHRDVALKQIRGAGLLSPQFRLRFEREARLASRLDHPHLCTIYDFGSVEDVPYIAMQLVAGQPLDARLEAALHRTAPILPSMIEPVEGELDGQPSPEAGLLPRARSDLDAVAAFFQQLAEAIHHAHERGLVHRDIKPGNVMVTPAGQPVVLDFGLARDEDGVEQALTQSGAVMGSPPYMAPEQIAPGAEPVDRRSDVWALGVTLYQTLTGQLPFAATTLHDLQRAILRAAPRRVRALNRSVPHDLEAIVSVALEADPARRYQTASAFAEDLRRFQEREPILARPAGFLLRSSRWIQRNQVVSVFLAMVTVALGVATVLYVQAETARAASESAIARFEELGSVQRLRTAEQEATLLYPARRSQVPGMLAWQRTHLPALRRDLETVPRAIVMLAKALGEKPDVQMADPSELSAIGPEVTRAGLDDAALRFLLGALREHLPRLQAFFGEAGAAQSVAARIRTVEVLEARLQGEDRERWGDACSSIAQGDGKGAAEAYRGLRIEPMPGLVPLGADPDSLLWEFLVLGTGDDRVPERDPMTGELRFPGLKPVVFVLLPGGSFLMGAQQQDESAPNFDPLADSDEQRVHSVQIAPFFLGKYEFTQHQWRTLTGQPSPSQYGPESGDDAGMSYDQPVEQISALVADSLCFQQGWCLPTEAQWEYACRAGTDTPWWTGELDTDAFGHVNFADRAFATSFGHLFSYDDRFSDGFVVHGPVGSFTANPFGLHDMMGNVMEWCSDFWADPYPEELEEGTGAHVVADRRYRVYRGGSYRKELPWARVSRRFGGPPETTMRMLGMRAAMRLSGG